MWIRMVVVWMFMLSVCLLMVLVFSIFFVLSRVGVCWLVDVLL